MKSSINWRYFLIAFLLFVGADGLYQAWPRSNETHGDLLVDLAILVAVIGVSFLLARLRLQRQRAKQQAQTGS